MKPIIFKDKECDISWSRYKNGRIAISLVHGGIPTALATVNLPGVELAPDEVLINDCSENKGVLAALVNAGIVEDTKQRVICGRTDIAVCRLKNML